MICKGWGGSIELLDDCVVIRRTYVLGLLFQKGIKGDKRIPYSSMSAVQFKRPGVLNGYIQFTIGGGNENVAGIIAAASDENSLQFVSADEFDKARDFIEKKLAARHTPLQPQIVATASSAEQLEKLASLLDRGLLTKEEFDIQKITLLAQSAAVPVVSDDQTEEKSDSLRRMEQAMDRAVANNAAAPSDRSTPRSTPSFGRRQTPLPPLDR